ncbi:hypothetical protein PHILAsVB114_06770 [Candidatus Planktophila limnetica]|uniref:Oligosaccharide repeat unit polymerase n=1 Tax=Candidatus Planktophila limnetica TaxID=573600 RepID=A0A249LHA5_9ACTN|nr:hypothetical protein [Candidatus Planktophila limnetica]ASY28296.1 hypothetical protein PHILAsVB114_06770 [Candidatus Planktophila limnetica]
MSLLLISLSVCEFALVAGFAVRKLKLIQAAPSLVWFALMTLPFIYQFQFFPTSPRMSQSIGLLIISTALALGDWFSIKTDKSDGIQDKTPSSHSRIIHLLTFLVIFIPAFHYWVAGTIPILDQYFGGVTPNQVSQDREDFVKLLDVPYLLKVLFHWVSVIFGPICVLWFYLMKRKLVAALILVWIVFYTLSSSADGPIVIFCWALVFAAGFAMSNRLNINNYLAVGISSALLFVIASGIWLGETAVSRESECGVVATQGFTPGDVMRSCSAENEIILNPIVNRLGYRVFLTPVEVSNHWYDYFDGSPSEKRKLLDVFERENSKQASNKVGVWAYTDRFPAHYGKSISANGSIDADAFSLGGNFFVLMVAFILFFIRIFVTFPIPGDSRLVRILQGIGLGQLAFLPNSAPMQAILLPQGLGLILFLLLVLRGKGLWTAFKSKIS